MFGGLTLVSNSTSIQNNTMKISVNEEWNTKSKLGVLGLIASIAMIVVVFLLN
jgi:hypothetical protein